VEPAAHEREREDDPGVLELVLIPGEMALALPEVDVEAQPGAEGLLESGVEDVLTLRVDQQDSSAQGPRRLDGRGHE